MYISKENKHGIKVSHFYYTGTISHLSIKLPQLKTWPKIIHYPDENLKWLKRFICRARRWRCCQRLQGKHPPGLESSWTKCVKLVCARFRATECTQRRIPYRLLFIWVMCKVQQNIPKRAETQRKVIQDRCFRSICLLLTLWLCSYIFILTFCFG